MIRTARKLPLQGVTNLRDLGGYQTVDGRTVKWHSLFRSDELAGLTEQDKAYLQQIGLQLIVDLRSTGERLAKPNPVIKGIDDFHLPVFDTEGHNGNVMEMMIEFARNPQASTLLVDINKSVITNETSLHAYKQLINYTVQMESPAILWHCTAGKDRTGLATAIILLALGVPQATIMEDYLLTNEYRKVFNDAAIQQARQKINDEQVLLGLRALLDVDKTYLQAALDEMQNQYGSINNFLKEGLDITEEKRSILQNKLLV